MKIRQLRNCVIIFIVFFLGAMLGFGRELLLLTILTIMSLAVLYIIITVVMVLYFQLDYDEIKETYNYLDDINKVKLKTQISCNVSIEKLEDIILDYNAQIELLANIIILNAEQCVENKTYKRFVPKDIYVNKLIQLQNIIEKTKRIIREI